MRPRIAHVISTRGMGGAERFLALLAVSAHARGCEQIVLNPFAVERSRELATLCHPVPYDARSCERVSDLPALHRWLRSRLADFRPDIVHVVLLHALLASVFRKQPDARYLLTHVYGEGALSGVRGRVTRLVDRAAVRRCDHVVAISEAVRQFLVSGYGLPEDKVTRIPLGWRGDPRPPATEPRPPTIVCVAALRPEKGHDVLLRAFSQVRRMRPDARLVLIGDGVLRPRLEAQASASGDADHVVFLGSVPDIWDHLARADVFTIASRSEAFGIAIAEAMAAGLPVVAPAVGATAELVEPGATGQLFPPGDANAMADHLVRLLASPDVRAKMGAAALAAAEPLRVENAVERYFEVYDGLLGRQPLV